jgi:EAL and modified HD-GYP domain-containing signal transduction protein
VALIRARAAEIVAGEVGADPEAAFLVGLVSALDALFQRPLDRLLSELPLAAEVQEAVLQQSGVLGHILGDVLSHESDDAQQITRFETGMVNRAWLDALIWAGDALDALR